MLVLPVCMLMYDNSFAAKGLVCVPFRSVHGTDWTLESRSAFVLHSFVLLFISLESIFSMSVVAFSPDRVTIGDLLTII